MIIKNRHTNIEKVVKAYEWLKSTKNRNDFILVEHDIVYCQRIYQNGPLDWNYMDRDHAKRMILQDDSAFTLRDLSAVELSKIEESFYQDSRDRPDKNDQQDLNNAKPSESIQENNTTTIPILSPVIKEVKSLYNAPPSRLIQVVMAILSAVAIVATIYFQILNDTPR